MVDAAQVITLKSIKWLTVLIRLELPLWVLLGYPPLLPILFAWYFIHPLAGAAVAIMGVLLGSFVVVVLGSLFDGVRRLVSVSTKAIPKNVAKPLNAAIEELKTRGALPATTRRLRVVLQDVSLAAHVNGVFLPRVVISGGMLVGLLQHNATARAILAHELAHIKHYDRVLPSLIMMVLINGVWGLGMFAIYGPENALGFHPLSNLAITIAMLGFISRRREYAADAYAAALYGSEYIATLCNHASHASSPTKGAFFHPSIEQRICALQRGCPVLRPSIFWLVVWFVYILLGANLDQSVLGTIRTQSDIPWNETKATSMCLLGLFGIFVELVKLVFLIGSAEYKISDNNDIDKEFVTDDARVPECIICSRRMMLNNFALHIIEEHEAKQSKK